MPGAGRSLALALLAHAVLIGALTLGVNWKHQQQDISAEAELWSAVPRPAAPQPVAPPAPREEPRPAPVRPAPPPKPEPVVDDAAVREAQIALAKQQAREQREREQAEAQRLRELKAKQEKDKERLAEQKKREAEQRAKDEKAAKEQKAKDDARFNSTVADMLKKAGGAAGGSTAGAAGGMSGGSGARSSGPSAGYQAKIAAAVRRNITYDGPTTGNPAAEVEVRLAPDGSVSGTPRLLKSSGNRAWDDAVTKAIIKTDVFPRDVDGRVQPVMVLSFRPLD